MRLVGQAKERIDKLRIRVERKDVEMKDDYCEEKGTGLGDGPNAMISDSLKELQDSIGKAFKKLKSIGRYL